ncbi:MAG: DegT/DnrJ/EryC1/StrS family aminotransferase [Armatimonadetes bacterium]|nr:DegT/DnrJ/EryC1/StrS family aminotransferase [Armatimonadota bacterium]
MSAAHSHDSLAIDGGTPVRTRPWPAWPRVDEAEWVKVIEPRLREVYLSHVEGLPGPRAHGFAAEFARWCGVEWGVMTPHGTDALMAAVAGALDLDGLRDPGEIIAPAYTFIATASAPLAVRCQVALADVDPETYTLDPTAVEALIGPDTVGIVAVHLGGQPADMTALGEVARRHGLALIEDCAQAHGAAWRGRRVGGWGDCGAFSFQSSKNLTCGEGGCVTTDDFDLYERVMSFIDVGRRPHGERWEYPRLGWNYRPSEYLAALLTARLPSVTSDLERRADNAAYLSGLLSPVDGLDAPCLAAGATSHAYHLYMMTYRAEAFGGRSRDAFVAALGAEGIPAMAGYTQPLSEQPALAELRQQYPGVLRVGDLTATREVCAHSVWLPQSLLLADTWEMDDVATAVGRIQRAWTR